MPGHDKHDKGKHSKHAIDIAARFTVTAIDSGFWPSGTKPEEVADFYLAVVKRIKDAPIDGDID
jgi:hypothetical protein